MVISPRLFSRLKEKFGDVAVHEEDVEPDVTLDRSVLSGRSDRPTLRVEGGEYYLLRCPFCDDHKKRLWVSCMLGAERYGQKMAFAAVCYNENCLGVGKNFGEFWKALFRPGEEQTFTVRPGRKITEEERKPRLPEQCLPLREAPLDHPAVQYLRRRGYDQVRDFAKFLDRWNPLFCLESNRWPLAEGRLIIPITFEGKFKGWQARSLQPEAKIKYYTMPGMKKSRLLYNGDAAFLRRQFAAVEGPLDVWGFGVESAAVLGKSISPAQLQLIVDAEPEVLYLIFDPAQSPKEKLKGRTHHMYLAERRLKQALPAKSTVVLVWLPEKEDPGSLRYTGCMPYVRAAATEAGVPCLLGLKENRRDVQRT